jgi:hypothetical protein
MEWLWIVGGFLLGLIALGLSLFVLGFVAALLMVPVSLGWAAAARWIENLGL